MPRSPLAIGTTGIIYAIDEDHVIKVPCQGEFDRLACERELRAYERLGHHERIAKYQLQDKYLQLERGTCLRAVLQGDSGSSVSLTTKLQWAQEAVEGLLYIHSKNVVHADVGCHNMILDKSGHLKFIDFAGSGIDGEDPLICYEWCSFRSGNGINFRSDIFALGSMLFEIETGKAPYSELATDLEMGISIRTVERLFSENKFPSVERLTLGEIISSCWYGRYSSMVEVQEDMALCIKKHKTE